MEETVATQADVQSARERDRLSALEGVLTQAWQAGIAASVKETTRPLKMEIVIVTEELKSLRQELTVLEAYRPDPVPVTQGGSATLTPAIAAVEPRRLPEPPLHSPRVKCESPPSEENYLR